MPFFGFCYSKYSKYLDGIKVFDGYRVQGEWYHVPGIHIHREIDAILISQIYLITNFSVICLLQSQLTLAK